MPPAGYRATKKNYEKLMENLKVQGPIEQNFNKRSGKFHSNLVVKGIYELVLIQKKSMGVLDYRKRVGKFDDLTDNKSIEEVEKMVSYLWNFVKFLSSARKIRFMKLGCLEV